MEFPRCVRLQGYRIGVSIWFSCWESLGGVLVEVFCEGSLEGISCSGCPLDVVPRR